jgi:RNA polymerase sigma-70 factor (ECF subfamily)
MAVMKKQAVPPHVIAQATPVNSPNFQGPFGHFFAHRRMLRTFVGSMTRDSTLVEDILSDIAIVVALQWDEFDRERPFAPWARGIARRVALKAIARRGRWQLGLPEDFLESPGADIDALYEQREAAARERLLMTCLEQLTPHTQELVRRRYFDEQRLPEIAQQVGITMGALYTAYCRIHRRLQRCMTLAEKASS